MIREMINLFEGIEFYRSTFNTETGDIVRITTEPDPNRRSWWRLEDEVKKEYFKKHPIDKTMAEKQQWDAQQTLHGEFQEKWKDQFGENSWHRSRAWSPSPETIDFAINDWCDVGCKNCYMDSKKTGRTKISVAEIVSILQSFNPLPYQVALGGGEPTAHPRFVEILQAIRELGVIPNFTTAGHFLNSRIAEAVKLYCGGIAISYHNHKGIDWFSETYSAWKSAFPRQINVHLIADKDVVENLNALKGIMPKVGIINLVLLAYYPSVGRSKLDGLMDKETYNVHLPAAINDAIASGMKISFSEGMIPYFISRPEIKMNLSMMQPQEGRFSCYIDTHGRMSESSFENDKMGKNERPQNYQLAWRDLYFHTEPGGEPCFDCALRNRCSVTNTHHYLICKYAPHNGGEAPKRKESYFDESD